MEVKVIEKTCGSLVVNAETNEIISYRGGYSEQGFIYKDETAFINAEGVAYIPEALFTANEKDEVTPQEVAESGLACTKEQIVEFCVGKPHIALDIFLNADWACIETYFEEFVANQDEEDLESAENLAV